MCSPQRHASLAHHHLVLLPLHPIQETLHRSLRPHRQPCPWSMWYDSPQKVAPQGPNWSYGALAFLAAWEIKTGSFQEDRCSSIMFEKFSFSQSSAVRIIASSTIVSSPIAWEDPKQLGFFVLSDESLVHVIYELRC